MSLLTKLKEKVGLSQPQLYGMFSLEQLAQLTELHPSLSELQVLMHDSDERNYQLIYRPRSSTSDVLDSERNIPSVKFSTEGISSQVKSFVDYTQYIGLAKTIADIFANRLNEAHYKTHGIKEIKEREIVKDYSMVITLKRPLTSEELVLLVNSLPDGNTDKCHLLLNYRNVRTFHYQNALNNNLPLRKPYKAKF